MIFNAKEQVSETKKQDIQQDKGNANELSMKRRYLGESRIRVVILFKRTESENSMNTKICYLYRDADNNKKNNECVIQGTLSEEQKKRILDCRSEGEWFIPNQVGLPEEKFDTVNLEVDHPWFELDEDGFSETVAEPTVDTTVAGLVNAFEKAKDKWDEFSWLMGLDIKEPEETDFYGIDALIRDAKKRRAEQCMQDNKTGLETVKNSSETRAIKHFYNKV